MCGFVGYIGVSAPEINLIKSMTESLDHRGPDSNNIWLESNDKIALGHTRLSILDLSKNGSQPMESKSKRYVITFNGEIYNHQKLRHNLKNKNYSWR